jgi:glyoxylase-like metal-dependent hydrolase (beta-lactamase superfamily II)
VKDTHPGRKHSPQQEIVWSHLKDGDPVFIGDYMLECLDTPGHTWGHICLYEANKKILFAGDHILGDITPNIQAWRTDDDPLQSYIVSLDKVSKLDIDLTLPGHRNFVRDTRGRIEELKTHHLDRCNEVLDILRQGEKHAYQTASQMSWEIRAKSWDDFPLMQKWFATGEAIAHLRFLVKRGLINSRTSADRTIFFSLADPGIKLESMAQI